jgi:hypothetical protein
VEGELKEGAYYVWKEEELKELLGDNFTVFRDYYNINNYGLWEEGNYILIRDAPEAEIAQNHGLGIPELRKLIGSCRDLLIKVRKKRPLPRLDNKILASWNGLMLQALADAYRYLGNDSYLDLALKNAAYIKANFINENGQLFHNNAAEGYRIPGYLEDYASIMEAFLSLYEITFDETWLQQGRMLADYCMEYYYDKESQLFYFTSKNDPFVVRRTLETADNVIPASNSIMAKNLFRLSKYFPEASYGHTARQMLGNMMENMEKYAQNHANWLQLLLYNIYPFYEIAILGAECRSLAAKLYKEYLPHSMLAGCDHNSALALLRERLVAEKSLIYICTNGSCQLPVESAETALNRLNPGDS